MKSVFLVASTAVLFSGCASVVNDTTHPIKIETKSEAGELVTGADCTLTNDKASTTVKSGDIANVRRSNKNLEIVCKHPTNPEALARATSRVNGGMFGNILLGGGIGMIVDHNRGTAYTYPTWMQLMFGKSVTFDRRDEKEGLPVPPAMAASAPEIEKKQ
ncbi:MAG: hypothetical protein LCH73_11115 [Proteobacteria bacterium]|nr:hypothetical protein [Pseudomonadota bacterium]